MVGVKEEEEKKEGKGKEQKKHFYSTSDIILKGPPIR